MKKENKIFVEKNNKRKIVVIVFLSALLALSIGYIAYDKLFVKKTNKCPQCIKCDNKQEVKHCLYNLNNLYGTYYGEKEHPNNSNFVHKVELTLKDNNEAVLHQSDGGSSDFSKGTFICDYDRIIYTPEYYDYEDSNDSKYQSSVQYTFLIGDDGLNYFYASTYPINLKRK